LRDRAVPIFQTVSAALAAEGFRFRVFTPAESVRLASENTPDDYVELTLDSTNDPPVVLGRTNRGRGRRVLTSERTVKENASIDQITDDDVLSFVLSEIEPFVER
jgi:hypothetical protein